MVKPSHSPKSTPATESVNKWKIPHYYRRSSSISSQQSGLTDSGAGSTPSTPNINVMTSPKRVLMDDPKKGKRKSSCRSRKNGKKKSGEMVFVNYTVQDSASEERLPSSGSTTPAALSASPVLPAAEPPSRKKKSSRSRMLKIFGSSKDSSEKAANTNSSFGETEAYQDTQEIPKAPGLTAKRSYSAFLKYGKFYGSSLDNASALAASPSLLPDNLSQEEIVPISSNNPKSVRPFVKANSQMLGGSHRGIHLLGRRKAYSELDINNYARKRGDSDELGIDHHYFEGDGNKETNASSADLCGKMKTMSSEPALAGNKQGDENDASIAFSKMFTRKRANTGGSMSSLISLNNSLQPHNVQASTNPNLMACSFNKNLSVSSISSTSNRYSPIRTASPARQRSATRGSSLHRVSRDSSSFQNTFEAVEPTAGPIVETESFLDAQGNKSSACTSGRHKRKQDSISDLHRNSTGNAVVTPSASLVTPPAFTPGYTAVSSVSAASTPSILELSSSIQMNASDNNGTCRSTYDHDSSSDALIQDTDVPTPVDSIPALKGIPRTTIEENEEEAETEDRYLQVCHNNDSLDRMLLANGSSTESSQVDSMFTNSVFSLATNNLWGQQWQDQGSFTMSANGSNLNGIKPDEQEKSASLAGYKKANSIISGQVDDYSTARCNTRKMSSNANLQTHMGFDFENSNAFFVEQPDRKSHEAINCYDRVALSSTPVNEQASTVTSVANFSPGTAATLSVEDINNNGCYHRGMRDHLNNSNTSMIHSSSVSSQGNISSNVGPWKMINSDLDAIADSHFFGEDPSDVSYV